MTTTPVSTHARAAPLAGARLALVMGSGGVRSIAAPGMWEVLAAEGIAPDLIVGYSAGAIFGALIAAGHKATDAVRMAGFDADFALRDDRPVVQQIAA